MLAYTTLFDWQQVTLLLQLKTDEVIQTKKASETKLSVTSLTLNDLEPTKNEEEISAKE